MNRWMHGLVAGSIIALAAVVAAAPVADYQVTVGTEFAVNAPLGANFGGKKPKVRAIFRGDDPVAKGDPKLKLKVRVNDSAGVALTVKKAKGAGTFDLEVTPRGGDPVLVGTIETLLPQINSTSVETILPKGDLVITGSFFGTKKPKVRIGGKKAKTLDFNDTEIRVRVHKKTPVGAADIVVQNKIGAATLPDGVEIADPDNPGGGTGQFDERVALRTSGDASVRFSADSSTITGALSRAGFTMSASGTERGATIELAISLAVDLSAVTPPQVVDFDAAAGDTCSLTITDGGAQTFALDRNGAGTGGDIRITRFDEETGQIVFSLDVDLKDAASGDTTRVVGDVVVDLTDNR